MHCPRHPLVWPDRCFQRVLAESNMFISACYNGLLCRQRAQFGSPSEVAERPRSQAAAVLRDRRPRGSDDPRGSATPARAAGAVASDRTTRGAGRRQAARTGSARGDRDAGRRGLPREGRGDARRRRRGQRDRSLLGSRAGGTPPCRVHGDDSADDGRRPRLSVPGRSSRGDDRVAPARLPAARRTGLAQ